MTKTYYIIVGEALSDLPISARLMVYRRLCVRLGARDETFDSERFGATMEIPPLFRKISKPTENEVKNAPEASSR